MKMYYYRMTTGILFVVFGLLIWLSNLGIIHITWYRDWPVIIIAIGVMELIKHIFRK